MNGLDTLIASQVKRSKVDFHAEKRSTLVYHSPLQKKFNLAGLPENLISFELSR